MKKTTTKNTKKKKKGFTLIELLAVIIILGILMIIAIPSVTKYINDSRKNAYIDTAKEIISGARSLVNEGKLEMYDPDTTYYLAAECIETENALKSPYGDFTKAYVVVTYNEQGYDYYWTSVDNTGQGIKNITKIDKLDTDSIESDLTDNDIPDSYGIDERSRYMIINKEQTNCGKGVSNDVTAKVFGETGELDPKTVKHNCEPGNYLPKNTTECTTCPAGSFCKGGEYYFNETSDQGKTLCTTGSYSDSGATSCTACPSGKTTSSSGKSSCNADCNNKFGVQTWRTPTWNSNNTVSYYCSIQSCKNVTTGVYTLKSGSCKATTTLYYKGTNTLKDNQNISSNTITLTANNTNYSYMTSNNGSMYSLMYFKYNIVDNIVKERYVCFTITSQMNLPNANPGEYCLRAKSGDATYQQNVAVLKSAFGNNNSYCTDSGAKYECKKSTSRSNNGAFLYSADINGNVYASYDEPVNGNAYPHYSMTVNKATYDYGGCLCGDTIVEVYDEKKKKRYKKKLRDVTKDDLILCWDFGTCKIVFVKPLWIKKAETAKLYYLLEFSDGSSLKIAGDHKVFDADRNKFVNAGAENELKIGSHVYNSEGKLVELVSWKKVKEEIDHYNVITNKHMNLFANGILTSCVFSNIYPIKDMKYVEKDIERLTDEDLEEIDEKYIEGLRLNEVPTNFRGSKEETISYVKNYVQKLISKEK